MSKLVNELKAEHVVLVNVLGEIKTMGVSSNEGRAKLMAAKDGLLAHLGKEDQMLYPVLKDKAKTDAGVKTMLDTFAKDMDGIATAAMAFFNKYEQGGSDIEFAKDFGALYGALGNRIRKEEAILYPEFDKLQGYDPVSG